jgi:hypothetical protein
VRVGQYNIVLSSGSLSNRNRSGDRRLYSLSVSLDDQFTRNGLSTIYWNFRKEHVRHSILIMHRPTSSATEYDYIAIQSVPFSALTRYFINNNDSSIGNPTSYNKNIITNHSAVSDYLYSASYKLTQNENDISIILNNYIVGFLYDDLDYKDAYVSFKAVNMLPGGPNPFIQVRVRNAIANLIASPLYVVDTYDILYSPFDYFNPVTERRLNGFIKENIGGTFYFKCIDTNNNNRTLDLSNGSMLYIDYTKVINPTDLNIMGYGYVLDIRSLRLNFSSSFRIVPYLTGLFHFLCALWMGYRPILYAYAADIIPSETIKDRPYTEFGSLVGNTYREKYNASSYRHNYRIYKKYGKIYINNNLQNEAEAGNNWQDFIVNFENVTKHRVAYLDYTHNYDDFKNWLEDYSIQSNARDIMIHVDYPTSVIEEPCYAIDKNANPNEIYEDWLQYLTDEPPSSITTEADRRVFAKSTPYVLFYSHSLLEYPRTRNNMRTIKIQKPPVHNAPDDAFDYVINDYKYPYIYDLHTLDFISACNANSSILDNTLLVDINNHKIYPPVINTNALLGNGVFNFSLITSGEILLYPKMVQVAGTYVEYYVDTSTAPNAEAVKPPREIYYREILLEKYQRMIINYAIRYVLYEYNNANNSYKKFISFSDFSFSMKEVVAEQQSVTYEVTLFIKTYDPNDIDVVNIILL